MAKKQVVYDGNNKEIKIDVTDEHMDVNSKEEKPGVGYEIIGGGD